MLGRHLISPTPQQAGPFVARLTETWMRGGWVGVDLFAGDRVNGVLAVALMVSSIGHALSVVTSVLGRRIHVGAATFVSGAVQVALAFALGSRIGVLGVVLASLGLVTLPVHLATYRELGVMRRFRSSGLSAGAIVGSHLALGAVLGVAASGIVLAVGALLAHEDGIVAHDGPSGRSGPRRLDRHPCRPT